jgi:hypothetical protein
MSQLLSIESSFLNLPIVKQSLNLQEIRSVQRTIVNAKKKKFEQTLALSKLVTKAVEWFQSEDGQRVCAEEGISWTNEEIGQKVFGWQKSFFYKVVKAGKLDEAVVDTFKAKCDEAETRGEDPNRSLEGLLKFAKAVESGAQDGGQGEDAESGDTSEAQIETRVETILTFTFKGDAGNVSVRIDANGNVKTTNSPEQIAEAIAVLQFSIQNQNQ